MKPVHNILGVSGWYRLVSTSLCAAFAIFFSGASSRIKNKAFDFLSNALLNMTNRILSFYGVMSRIKLLPVSAMKICPSAVTTKPCGPLNVEAFNVLLVDPTCPVPA